MAKAEITTGGNTDQIRITIRDYIRIGDTVTMNFDSATHRPTKTRINTTFDDAAVLIALSFDQIGEGPNYPGKTVVSSDAKQLEVRLFTYDYHL